MISLTFFINMAIVTIFLTPRKTSNKKKPPLRMKLIPALKPCQQKSIKAEKLFSSERSFRMVEREKKVSQETNFPPFSKKGGDDCHIGIWNISKTCYPNPDMSIPSGARESNFYSSRCIFLCSAPNFFSLSKKVPFKLIVLMSQTSRGDKVSFIDLSTLNFNLLN